MLHEMTNFAGAMRRWSAARRTARSLHSLDDSTLKDIGLHRSQIDQVAKNLRSRVDLDA